jgi:hypothetical protein
MKKAIYFLLFSFIYISLILNVNAKYKCEYSISSDINIEWYEYIYQASISDSGKDFWYIWRSMDENFPYDIVYNWKIIAKAPVLYADNIPHITVKWWKVAYSYGNNIFENGKKITINGPVELLDYSSKEELIYIYFDYEDYLYKFIKNGKLIHSFNGYLYKLEKSSFSDDYVFLFLSNEKNGSFSKKHIYRFSFNNPYSSKDFTKYDVTGYKNIKYYLGENWKFAFQHDGLKEGEIILDDWLKPPYSIFIKDISDVSIFWGWYINNRTGFFTKKENGIRLNRYFCIQRINKLKQLFFAKNNLKKTSKGRNIIKKINLITEKVNYKKLEKVYVKIQSLLSSVRKHKKYKYVLNYLEARIWLKLIWKRSSSNK